MKTSICELADNNTNEPPAKCDEEDDITANVSTDKPRYHHCNYTNKYSYHHCDCHGDVCCVNNKKLHNESVTECSEKYGRMAE